MARKSRKTTRKAPAVGFGERVARQFRGLSLRDGGSWPLLPRYALFLLIVVAVVGALWSTWLRSVNEDLDTARAQEAKLKQEYHTKLQKAVSLEELKKQKAEVAQYVAVLEKQLPGKAEMDALLSDINQAGVGRSLQFDLFKPGQVAVKDYYAELPIAIKIAGRYHDIGQFAADIAKLPRIVTLGDLVIAPNGGDKGAGDTLLMQATAKTYRYLDPDEVAAQRAAQSGGKK